jgi:biopolymer transport protein ExbD
MIDVTFLLIIFFLCVTEMARMEYEQICLPQARSAVEEGRLPTNRQVVNVTYRQIGADEEARVMVRGRWYERSADLVAHLKTVCERSSARGEAPVTVKIRADSRVPYDEVRKVMASCAKAGISRISIGAAPERNTGRAGS